MKGTMTVLSEGFLAMIQDQGRFLCQHLGLAEAGALDKHALFWGNRLVGNPPHTPAVELLLGNCSFTFDAPSRVAITGASMPITVNDQPVSAWSVLHIQAGDLLHCGGVSSGLRAYLSIAGGFKTAKFFGSSSTVIREKTGGNQGNKLRPGDTLLYEKPTPQEQANQTMHRVPERYIPDYDAPLTLHFFPGYHYHQFADDSVQQCLDSAYIITQEADRMGYRLAGPPLRRKGSNILSVGVPCGAIQVPTAGEPIILLNDRQCTGGYPVLGVVCARDIYRLAQKKPGDKVRFALGDLTVLQRELQAFSHFFQQRHSPVRL